MTQRDYTKYFELLVERDRPRLNGTIAITDLESDRAEEGPNLVVCCPGLGYRPRSLKLTAA